jgi:hypothetical protein
MTLEPDEIWDSWCRAREAEPLLEPEAFAEEYGEQAAHVLDVLGPALILEELRPTPLPPELEQSATLGLRIGPYRVQGEVGRGGFGLVLDAIDEQGTRVALKLVNPLLAAGRRQQELLLTEARLLKRLDHPGVVRLVDCGRERGLVWLAMEFVGGVPLDQLPPLGAGKRHARALGLGRQLSDALEAAHAGGIVHRDLKPSNVLVDTEERLRVLDFGLAQRFAVTVTVSQSATHRARAGTPAFMAPEQLEPGGRIGPWTDVHACGFLLLLLAEPELRDELLSSRRVTRRRLGEARSLPGWCLRSLPHGLRVVVARCLEPNPADRYASARALGEDLAALIEGRSLVHGRPSRLWRGLRKIRRHPLRSIGTMAAALLAGWGWYVASIPPLPQVRIDTHLSGKELWVDGENLGVTPLTATLAPGPHTWRARWGGLAEPAYEGVLVVPESDRAAFLLTLNPTPLTRWHPEDPYVDVPPGAGAWLRVAAGGADGDLEVTLTGLPGGEPLTFTDYVHLRLPFGRHELSLAAPGRRSVNRILDVDDQLMRSWTTTLDPVGDPWHSVPVYSLFEEAVGVPIEAVNLRTYIESGVNVDTGQAVTRSYFGPLRSGLGATVGFWVDLPIPVGELRVEGNLSNQINDHSDAWLLLELGPDPANTIALAGYRGQDCVNAPQVDGLPAAPENSSRLEELSESMLGRQRIFVRYTIGPSAAGDLYAYGQALRTEMGPEGEGWWPALTIRVRR